MASRLAVSITAGPRRSVPHSFVAVILGLMITAVSHNASATTILTFEDQLDNFTRVDFATSYQGVTWTIGHWAHYAPYEPNGYDPDGVNAIFANNYTGSASQYNSFTFPDQIFVGASFSAPRLLTPEFATRMFFELFNDGTLVHTSADLSSGALTFLSSGYAGAVDEVRVWTVANGGTIGSLMTLGGSAWIMDNVTFEPSTAPVPEPATFALLGVGLVAAVLRRHKRGV
ncbi:MAG: PEP-CTERM sorting domain-containing protein [Acidobacteria bacterium]|nr:PEP-CTERM sorting domain-containing protein [Acidobacteriota bacterium]